MDENDFKEWHRKMVVNSVNEINQYQENNYSKSILSNSKQGELLSAVQSGNSIECLDNLVTIEKQLSNTSQQHHENYLLFINYAPEWTDGINRDWYGDTALIAAARDGQFSTVKLLLETGVCDPWLESCPEPGVQESALTCVGKKLHEIMMKVTNQFI